MGDPENREEKPPEVKWELAPGFRASWKKYLADYPDIKAAMREFDRCKRATPPVRLPGKMEEHKLDGPLKGFYDCHLAPDAVLIYKPLPNGGMKLFTIGMKLFTMCNHGDLKGPKAKALVKRIK